MAAEQSQKASQDKYSHKHQVPFLNNLDKDGQLSQSWFLFHFYICMDFNCYSLKYI